MSKVNTLFIDMDGVIINSIQTIVDCYNEDYIRNTGKLIHPNDIRTWNFEELIHAHEEYVNYIFRSQRFFDKVQFFDGCVEFLKGLNYCGWDIKIVTMGHPINLALKKEFIEKHLPFCELVGVNANHFSDKSHVDMSGENSYFVDDLAENLIASNCVNIIMFGEEKPWNESWVGIRCYNYYGLMWYFDKEGLM